MMLLSGSFRRAVVRRKCERSEFLPKQAKRWRRIYLFVLFGDSAYRAVQIILSVVAAGKVPLYSSIFLVDG